MAGLWQPSAALSRLQGSLPPLLAPHQAWLPTEALSSVSPQSPLPQVPKRCKDRSGRPFPQPVEYKHGAALEYWIHPKRRTINRLCVLALLRAEDLEVPIKHFPFEPRGESCSGTAGQARPTYQERKGSGDFSGVEQEGFPREPGSADEATPSCDGPADESNGGSSCPDSSSSSSCRNSSSNSHISCKSTSSKRSSSSASDGKSEHRGEYCKGFKLSQTFAKGQHVGYEATCYLHMAGDGWTCRRTCNFVKNNNPERRRP